MSIDFWFSMILLAIGIWGMVIGSKLDTIINLLKPEKKNYGYKVEPPKGLLELYVDKEDK